jgi:hypothetical protein
MNDSASDQKPAGLDEHFQKTGLAGERKRTGVWDGLKIFPLSFHLRAVSITNYHALSK